MNVVKKVFLVAVLGVMSFSIAHGAESSFPPPVPEKFRREIVDGWGNRLQFHKSGHPVKPTLCLHQYTKVGFDEVESTFNRLAQLLSKKAKIPALNFRLSKKELGNKVFHWSHDRRGQVQWACAYLVSMYACKLESVGYTNVFIHYLLDSGLKEMAQLFVCVLCRQSSKGNGPLADPEQIDWWGDDMESGDSGYDSGDAASPAAKRHCAGWGVSPVCIVPITGVP